MERVKKIKIPVIADSVLSPDFLYGDQAGIYFVTCEDRHGRITFENLDAVKICRGEVMPYALTEYETGVWVYQIENSAWQNERFAYEKKHYGDAYEFGGNVNEMLTDFKHYYFEFHDEFIEVIARGFWFEENGRNLFKKPLQKGHPFLPLSQEGMDVMMAHGLTCQIRRSTQSEDQLQYGAQFCSHRLFEFALTFEGKDFISHQVMLSYRSDQLISTLRSSFGKPVAEFSGIANLEQVKPYIEQYMAEVSERRKAAERL